MGLRIPAGGRKEGERPLVTRKGKYQENQISAKLSVLMIVLG